PSEIFVTSSIPIRSPEMLNDALASVKRAGTVAIRLETDNAPAMRAGLHGIAFAPEPEVAYYVSIQLENREGESDLGGLFGKQTRSAGVPSGDENEGFAVTLDELRPLLEDPAISRVGYNVKFAEIVLERHGIYPPPFAFDVLIAAYLLNAGRASYPL